MRATKVLVDNPDDVLGTHRVQPSWFESGLFRLSSHSLMAVLRDEVASRLLETSWITQPAAVANDDIVPPTSRSRPRPPTENPESPQLGCGRCNMPDAYSHFRCQVRSVYIDQDREPTRCRTHHLNASIRHAIIN